MKFPDIISIRPLSVPVNATVVVPGSRSVTVRVLMLSALAHGRSILHGALWVEDTEAMVDNLRKLGFEVEVRPENSHPSNRTIEVEGQGGRIPNAGTAARPLELQVGGSDAAARFLAALVCLRRGCFRIDGAASIRERSMADLVDALRQLGVAVRCGRDGDGLPLFIESPGLQGGEVRVSAESSSQFASALMLVSGCMGVNLVLRIAGRRVSAPFLDLTSSLMTRALARGMGSSSSRKRDLPNESRIEVPSVGYRAQEWLIEPDASTASVPLAMAAILGGSIRIPRLTAAALQGDIRFWIILREHCDRCALPLPGEECTLTGPWRWAEEQSLYFAPISDTFAAMAVIAPFGQAPLTLNGLRHIRRQEGNRLAVVVMELERAGVRVEIAGEDAIRVHPCDSWRETTVRTRRDHRIAMAFSALGMRDVMGGGRPWLRIENPSCVARSFPGFFETVEDVARQSYGCLGQPLVPTVLDSDGRPIFQ